MASSGSQSDMSGTAAIETRELFGVPIAAATMTQAVALAEEAIRERKPQLIGVVNAAKLVNMRKNPALHDSVMSADVIYADGMSVVWASRWLGRPLPERVAGIDLMHALMRRADEQGFRVFCLGATQEVLDESVRRLQALYPGAVIAGSHHGYFDEAGEEAVARAIGDARADLLFVAMTSPKKEKFLARWSSVLQVSVCHGVGGSFDVLAGKVRRAPRLWQKLGLEWLYRALQEPLRLGKRYLVTNTVFIGMCLRARFLPRSAVDKTASARHVG